MITKPLAVMLQFVGAILVISGFVFVIMPPRLEGALALVSGLCLMYLGRPHARHARKVTPE